MSKVLMDISLHADTQHRAVDLSRYQFIRLSTPQNLPYLKQSLGEVLEEDCRSVASDGIEQLASLFLVLHSTSVR